jgi:hypothetical protein
MTRISDCPPLVAALIEAVEEVVSGEATSFDDERLRYLEIQVNRIDWGNMKSALAAVRAAMECGEPRFPPGVYDVDYEGPEGMGPSREERRYRCESCGEYFDEPLLDHARAVDDGHGNPIPVQCGPISEEKGPSKEEREEMVRVFVTLLKVYETIGPIVPSLEEASRRGVMGKIRRLIAGEEGK